MVGLGEWAVSWAVAVSYERGIPVGELPGSLRRRVLRAPADRGRP